jgi:hypothetical protein
MYILRKDYSLKEICQQNWQKNNFFLTNILFFLIKIYIFVTNGSLIIHN